MITFSIGPEFGHKIICEKSSESFKKITEDIRKNKELISDETTLESSERILLIFETIFRSNFQNGDFLNKNIKNLVILSAVQVSTSHSCLHSFRV